jgi:TonB-linked SusC/RagA family outer membrane protein
LETGLRSQTFFDGIIERSGWHNTNWIDVYMNDNALTYQTDVSVRGGGGRTTYFISGNHFSQDGTAYGSHFERYSARMNVESEAKSWLRVGMNTHLSRDNRRSNNNWGTGANFLSGGLSALIEPWFSSEEINGRMPGTGGTATGLMHPRHLADFSPSSGVNSQLTGSFFVEITPMERLKFISRAGTSAHDWTSIGGMLPTRADRLTHADRGTKGVLNEQFITMNINNVVQYSFNVSDAHSFTALLGHEGTTYNSRVASTSAVGITDERLWNLQNGTTERTTASESTSGYSFLSFFGRVDYNFNERFFGEFTLRNDASSRFGTDNRNAWFWAIGGMWRMTNEPFIQNIPLITDARLNISYGTQGNAEIGNFTRLGLVGSRSAAANQYDGNTSWMITSIENPGLSWENQDKLTIGIHTELANKYNVVVEFYQRSTRNMLMGVPQPGTSGFGTRVGNVGSIRNRGIDITLGMEFFRTRDWHVGADFIFNYNKEVVTELFGGQSEWIVPATGVGYIVGQPVMFYYPIAGGVDRNNGRLWWYLPGDDPNVTTTDPNRTTQLFDEDGLLQNTGIRRFAPVNGGFGLNAGWKGFQLRADFAFVLGKWMICNTSYFTLNPNVFDGFNQDRSVNDFWRNPGDNAKFPDWRQRQEMEFDTRLLSNASFMRLKNLTVSYNLPRNLLARTNNVLHNVRIFATGRNLFTITNFMGIDPEVDSNLAMGSYINSRQFQIGLELNF